MKSARQRPFHCQSGKSILLILQLLMSAALAAGVVGVRKSKKLHLKRVFLLPSVYFPAFPCSGAGGSAADNLGTIDPLGGIARVDDQLGFADDLFVIIGRVIGDDHDAIILAEFFHLRPLHL